MTTETLGYVTTTPLGVSDPTAEAARSAVSWPAILAGAAVAGAVSLLLVALGAGFGLAAASPWRHSPVAAFSLTAGIWLIVTQWIASGFGGYMTGRMRVRWTSIHTHEVFFRDTAHGFLTWSVATLMVALLAAGAATLGADAASHGAAATRGEPGMAGPYVDQTDTLFRSARPDDSASAAAARLEAGRIIARDVADATAARPDDRPYLASLVMAHAGLAPDAAQARVDAALNDARQAADKARKASSATAIFTGLAMLIGAFIACVAAALGGQQRDEHL